MLGRLAGSVHAARTGGIASLTLVAMIAMAILLPSAARASGCDSWTNTKGGSWFEGTNWSSKAPPTSTEEACITAAGTYTVTMTQTGTTGTVTVKSLVVGGSSGTQTLVVSGSDSLNATLTAASGISITSAGAAKLTNGEAEVNTVTLVAPITNAGTITTEGGVGGGARTFQGNLKNTGTLAINTTTTFNGTSAALTNEGALNVAEGRSFTVSNKASFTNGPGGKIVGAGSGDVFLESGTSFTEAAGTTTGTMPVVIDDGALNYTGAGASTIVLRGASTLSGSTSLGQSLIIQGTDAENVTVTAATGFTNAGEITLTQIETEDNKAALVVSSGVLTNTGTITSEAGAGSGSARALEGSVTNKGTLAINTTTTFDGTSAALINDAAINIAVGATFSLPSGQSFSNETGGIIAATGTGQFEQRDGTFNEGAGKSTGTDLIIDDGALNYTGAGASTIVLRGASTLSGSTSLGQSLIIQGTDAENVTVTAATGFTNAGEITLTQIETEDNKAALVVSSGVLTNTGTITSEAGAGSGSARALEGSVTNKGTLAINTTTTFDGTSAALINDAAINIAVGATFSLPSGQSFSNETGGIIAATGTGQFEQRDGTFNEGAGKSTGTGLVLDDDALHYMGAGASTIVLRGASTLSGNISAGQSLTIQATDAENATATAATSFTNSGKVTLIQIEAEDNRVNLVLEHAGTLTNKGTITIGTGPVASSRTIEGNVKNEKSLLLAAGATLTLVGSYTQGKKAGLQTTFGVSGNPGKLSATGTAVIAGKLTIKQSKTFKPAKGESFALLSSSGLTGKFSSVKGKKIKKSSSSYVPTYSATAVTLVVS